MWLETTRTVHYHLRSNNIRSWPVPVAGYAANGGLDVLEPGFFRHSAGQARQHAARSVRGACFALVGYAVSLSWASNAGAQWPVLPDASAPRDRDGNVMLDAPPPRRADGTVDLSGLWMRARTIDPGEEDEGGGGGFLEPRTQAIVRDPDGPPIASFGDAGQNMEGGLPFTPWGKVLRDARDTLNSRDNPDAQCLPMGFLQFHQQPQPREIFHMDQMILIEYEANYGVRHIYLDGRELPPQGEPQPWWYGYSVGHWEDDVLVVETNNLRGADQDSPYDGWLDVNGSPYTREAVITERFSRPTYGHLRIDFTLDDPVAYTRPWTVRVEQRLLPDQELIEFICNENQQFGRRIELN
jgi:hypothetical protein